MAKQLMADERDLGEFTVRRILPNKEKKMVGPFIFFDHMGPADFPSGSGVNVRPHPHIGLATITYLFEGSILHRDSLGSVQEIFPGEVNWMTAGRGIVHSERETLEVRGGHHRTNGLQCWLALPKHLAEMEPNFFHYKKEALPHIYYQQTMMRLIAGEAYGRVSPVKVYWPMFYLDIVAGKGATFKKPAGHDEAALYILSGRIEINNTAYEAGSFLLLQEEDEEFRVTEAARAVMVGGEKFEETPIINWNFVSFDPQRIRNAEEQWKAGKFPQIPGDADEFIPLNGKEFVPL